jgi:hypothetical protein
MKHIPKRSSKSAACSIVQATEPRSRLRNPAFLQITAMQLTQAALIAMNHLSISTTAIISLSFRSRTSLQTKNLKTGNAILANLKSRQILG